MSVIDNLDTDLRLFEEGIRVGWTKIPRSCSECGGKVWILTRHLKSCMSTSLKQGVCGKCGIHGSCDDILRSNLIMLDPKPPAESRP